MRLDHATDWMGKETRSLPQVRHYPGLGCRHPVVWEAYPRDHGGYGKSRGVARQLTGQLGDGVPIKR
jgi:hypothetical protein